MTQKQFIEMLKEPAIEAYRKYHILPSLTIAQAILESGWGKHAPGFNLFGMKWSEGSGYDYQLLKTKEFINGKYVTVMAKFRKYKSYAESIEDHTRLLLKPRYAAVRKATNYREAAEAVHKAGYATSPVYAQSLIKIIEANNLQAIDDEARRPLDYAAPDPANEWVHEEPITLTEKLEWFKWRLNKVISDLIELRENLDYLREQHGN